MRLQAQELKVYDFFFKKLCISVLNHVERTGCKYYLIASSYPPWKRILQDILGKFKKTEKARNVSNKFAHTSSSDQPFKTSVALFCQSWFIPRDITAYYDDAISENMQF